MLATDDSEQACDSFSYIILGGLIVTEQEISLKLAFLT